MTALLLATADDTFAFTWDALSDHAQVRRRDSEATVWSGSLLPLFELVDSAGRADAVKPTVVASRSRVENDRAELALEWQGGTGRLDVQFSPEGVRFTALEVHWAGPTPPRLRALFFGRSFLTAEQRTIAPAEAGGHWPDWRAEGYCVASARTNPIQSFFRSWDFGHASLPLGSFGPALGTPYVAAFPRPLYAACLGGRHGWICAGAGDLPDAALTLEIRARSGTLAWHYREDLWGGPTDSVRRWVNPLWLTWAADAWLAYRGYFRLFPIAAPKPASHLKSFWGTWGDFRLDCFDLPRAIERAAGEMEADVMCVDDPWESGKGSGRPDARRFPLFTTDLAQAHTRRVGVGLWLPLAWIADYAAEGLTVDDLLIGANGRPVRSNWAVDPREEGVSPFCLDPSSPRTRAFLQDRTRRLLHEYRPSLLKLDFGYGLPGPDTAVPRDPRLRGERLAWTCAQLIADAAHAIDPALTVLYYSLHPLWDRVADQCALDDLGDAGVHEAAGHGQWSIWAALAGERGLPLLASSGYAWEADPDNLLNSAIVGAPGANLPSHLPDGRPLPAVNLARRRALFRWHRRTTVWTPCWLDSPRGDLAQEPGTRNWGRLETIAGEAALTALALRTPTEAARAAPELHGLTWSGRWIALALGDAPIFSAREVALIPFDAGWLELPRARAPRDVRVVFVAEERSHPAWSWADGRLRIDVTPALAAEPCLGLLVRDA